MLCEWLSSVASSKSEKESMSRTSLTRSCCFGDACEETVMHVKRHDYLFGTSPYSLFFPAELHLILLTVALSTAL